MKLSAIFGLALVLALQAAVAGGPIKTSYVTIIKSAEIKAPKEKVWKLLVSPKGLATLMKLEGAKGAPSMDKVGASLRGKISGDDGSLVVTRVVPGEELRAAWEVDQGHYACHAAVTLQQEGDMTIVTFKDGYSDEKPETLEATARDTEKMLGESLQKFVQMAVM